MYMENKFMTFKHLWNYWDSFNQTLCGASFGKGDSDLFKSRAYLPQPSPRGDINNSQIGKKGQYTL